MKDPGFEFALKVTIGLAVGLFIGTTYRIGYNRGYYRARGDMFTQCESSLRNQAVSAVEPLLTEYVRGRNEEQLAHGQLPLTQVWVCTCARLVPYTVHDDGIDTVATCPQDQQVYAAWDVTYDEFGFHIGANRVE